MESVKGKVSIIIPTRNRSSYLRRAVDAAFEQSYDNIEVVVSNNASTDDTKLVLDMLGREYSELIIIDHPSLLPLNEHWDSVIKNNLSGEYIIILSDDDILTDNDYIRRVVYKFEKYSSIGLVFANYNVVNSSFKVTSTINAHFDEYIPKMFLYENFNKHMFDIKGIGIPLLTAVFRKSAYLDVNGFNLDCMSTDTHLWLKLLLKYDAGFIVEPVADYLVHDTNLSNTQNLDYKFNDTRIVEDIRKYAIENNLYNNTVKETLVRMDKVFYRNFHYSYISNLLNFNFKYIGYWRLIKFKYFFNFLFNKLVGKDYPND